MNQEQLVEAASFGSIHEAELAASALRAAGIDCSLRDSYVAASHPDLMLAINGTGLMIARSDLAAAREVLDGNASVSTVAEESDEEHFCANCERELTSAMAECPSCNAGEHRVVRTAKTMYWQLVALKTGVLLVTLALVFAPSLWDRFTRLPENVVSRLAYTLLAVIAAFVVIRFLRRSSEERL